MGNDAELSAGDKRVLAQKILGLRELDNLSAPEDLRNAVFDALVAVQQRLVALEDGDYDPKINGAIIFDRPVVDLVKFDNLLIAKLDSGEMFASHDGESWDRFVFKITEMDAAGRKII